MFFARPFVLFLCLMAFSALASIWSEPAARAQQISGLEAGDGFADGQKWSFQYSPLDRPVSQIGTVEYRNGKFTIRAVAQEMDGQIRPRPAPSIIVSQSSDGIEEIVFKLPSIDTRTLGIIDPVADDGIGDSVGIDDWLIRSISVNAEEINAQIQDPDKKIGFFSDGKKISQRKHDIILKRRLRPLQKYTSEGKIPPGDLSVFAAELLPLSLSSKVLQKIASGLGPNGPSYSVNFQSDYELYKLEDTGMRTETRALRSTALVFASFSAGAELILSNPDFQDDDGQTIHWDWSVRIDTGTITEARGSSDEGNPIVWGPAPDLEAVVVLNDQEKRRGAGDNAEKTEVVYPWLDENAQARIDQAPARFTRRLVLIGGNLESLEGHTPVSNSAAIQYTPLTEYDPADALRELAELEEHGSYTWPGNGSTRFVDAYRSENPDALVLTTTATLHSSIEAQQIEFLARATKGDWPLMFGDHKGTIKMVRIDVPSQETFPTTLQPEKTAPLSKTREELANPVVFRDEILLEAQFDFEPDADEILVTLDGAIQNEGIGPKRETVVPLERVEGTRNTFRSPPLLVVDAESYRPKDGSVRSGLASKADDYGDVPEKRALAWGENRMLRPRFKRFAIDRPLPDAPVIIGDKLFDAGEGSLTRGLFNSALERAARCYPSNSITSDFLVSSKRTAAIRTKAGTLRPRWSGSLRSLNLTYGQHAAFILLRDQYVKNMRQVRNGIAALTSQGSERIEAAHRQIWHGYETPISGLTTPGGSTLKQFVHQQRAGSRYLRRRHQSAFGSMLRQMRENIDRSLAAASQAGDCRVPQLMNFAGHGLDPIVRQLQAMVTISEQDDRGIKRVRPDIEARVQLQTASITKDIYNAYGGEADAIKNAVKLAGAAATLGLGAVYGLAAEGTALASSAAYGIAAISATDFAFTAADNAVGYADDQEKLNIARGAAAYYGAEYLKHVQSTTTSAAFRSLDVFGAGLGAYGDASAALFPQARELSKLAGRTGEILETANRNLANYSDMVTRADPAEFERLARDFVEKMDANPLKAINGLEGAERAAVEHLLSTPESNLTDDLFQMQARIRRDFENPDALLSDGVRFLQEMKEGSEANSANAISGAKSVISNTTDPAEALGRFEGNNPGQSGELAGGTVPIPAVPTMNLKDLLPAAPVFEPPAGPVFEPGPPELIPEWMLELEKKQEGR